MKYLFFGLAAVLLTTGIAQAHTVETDGNIKGVMHISPAHEPTAGEPAHFKFFMSRYDGRFDPNAYTLTLSITGDGIATATVPVSAKGTELSADYTFTHEIENATAALTGSSTIPGQPSFSFEFDDIKVLPPGQHQDPIDNLLEQHGGHVLLTVLIILAFGIIYGYDRLVARKRAA